MEKRFLSYADIVRAESVTAGIARQEIGKWLEKFEKLIDLLLKLNYFFKKDIPASDDNPADWFFAFVNEKYFEAPYSLHVCNSLMRQGHYLNAMIQLRSVLDYFVSCRYLYDHPQYVIPYRKKQKCLIDGKERWLGTGHIYRYFSEDFYDRYYGDMLSCLSHGKLGPSIYRIDRSNPLEARVIMVPEFNLRHSFSIINHLIPIVYGYLSHREVFFKGRLIDLPTELEEECKSTMVWLAECHKKQVEAHPESKEWADGINKLSGISYSSPTCETLA